MGKSIVLMLIFIMYGCEKNNYQKILLNNGPEVLYNKISKDYDIIHDVKIIDSLIILSEEEINSPIEYLFYIDSKHNKLLIKAPFNLSCADALNNDLCQISLVDFNIYLKQHRIIEEEQILGEFLSIYNYYIGSNYIICETIYDTDAIINSNNRSMLNNLSVLTKDDLEKIFSNKICKNEIICWFPIQGLIKFTYTIENGSFSVKSKLLGGLGVEIVPI